MRVSVPFASVITHTLPAPVARPPSDCWTSKGSVASTLPSFRLTRIRLLPVPSFAPQLGTHRLPNPTASPEHGCLPTAMLAATLFVLGSSRWTVSFGLFETHTCSSMARQSGTPGSSNTASGFSFVMGIFTPGVLTPGRLGFCCACEGDMVPDCGACPYAIQVKTVKNKPQLSSTLRIHLPRRAGILARPHGELS